MFLIPASIFWNFLNTLSYTNIFLAYYNSSFFSFSDSTVVTGAVSDAFSVLWTTFTPKSYYTPNPTLLTFTAGYWTVSYHHWKNTTAHYYTTKFYTD